MIDYGFLVGPEVGQTARTRAAQGLEEVGGSGRDTPPASSPNTGDGMFAKSPERKEGTAEEPEDLDAKFERRCVVGSNKEREREAATPSAAARAAA